MRDVAAAALKQQNAEHEEYNLMAAGEAVGVTLRLHNRLAVKVKATQIRLVCEFTPLVRAPSRVAAVCRASPLSSPRRAAALSWPRPSAASSLLVCACAWPGSGA